MSKTLILVVGPTAVGKTALSIELANHFKTEILSCDSRQFYRETEIGTAKPNTEELAAATHHFINSHSILDTYSVGDYERDALKKLEHLFGTKDTAIMVGGSGLYVKAICEGLDDFPTIDPNIRTDLNALFEKEGIDPLQQKLKELDPVYFEKVDIQNSQRIIRAIEVCIGTGKPYSSFTKSSSVNRPFKILKVGLNQDRETLYERINLRVDLMVKAGLEEEAKQFHHLKHINALQTVGYQELFSHFDGETTLEEAIELVKRNSRRYAKKQLTWFRKDTEIHWFETGENNKVIHFLEKELYE